MDDAKGRFFRWLLAGAVAFLAGAIAYALWDSRQAAVPADDPQQVALGRQVYERHCASCHGARLEGQPNWRSRLPTGRMPAPPHDESGHTWHHPDAVLFEVAKNGLKNIAPPDYQSDMPAYAGILTDDQIRDVLAYIKSTWPPEIRARQERLNARP